ncbi:hypothetical protein ACRALDRAFT_2041758 [Sodiomyces alcalophilus JCM 7366]|uniref:uncharacterized protein n=1 Tax=Sodiomyces alcalophilus JCM 7366 TaxID=591952 RepID=UPI0039B3EF31
MATSPPASPSQRPMSVMVRPAPRSNSRMSMTSRTAGGAGGSRASDEDTRTAVRVAVRVRPPLKPTDPGFDLIPQRFQRSMVQVTTNTNIAIDSPQGKKIFVFDRVFGADVDQEGVWEYLNDSVNAFIQGYNVSLLAYGQSGAGKSYTMGTSGPSEQNDPEVMGVIPRAAAALFSKLDGPRRQSNRGSMSQLRTPSRYSHGPSLSTGGDRGWQLKASYVEIYNEQLRDLLLPDNTPPHERATVTIREDTKGNIILTGLHQVDINSVDDLMNALNFGSTVRQTDATAINARSSRSHAVFSLNLVQRKRSFPSTTSTSAADKRFSVPIEAMTGNESWVTTDSKLHFVDLAGSERLKNTGAQGERAKEGISINAGLAALGKVISQLSLRSAGSHVSYRDSKLTRLLQDSLGGNAVTYMIACVTPAEFHLSETLNTVQYAQRARAIQSKPRIQQIEEGDKQAIIERLKAEVAFLRDQVRNAERHSGDRRALAPDGSRSDRQNEREMELQDQLLDIQENYTTLSHRHAKLIAEMARARDAEQADQYDVGESLDNSATERLNRSNSFAQAVEQVVLEYEKTIQSLEQSLSSTRSTLSCTETSLLERETKCAYVETLNAQLQARLQKLMDREASTENYLHDLEAKLDGHTSGEEKNAAIIVELRKEIARARENEAACEDYISTLEERLAEADQDAELMQREIDRLEQVIERQRSLGKLDSLLYELDHIQGETKMADQEPEPEPESSQVTNGTSHRRKPAEHSRSLSHVSHMSRMSHRDVIHEDEEDAIPEEPAQTETETDEARTTARSSSANPDQDESKVAQDDDSLKPQEADYIPPSPAQTKFVADKLENVTQELLDLRVEHETTVQEYDALHGRYEEALRALRELQDTIDESRYPNRAVRDSMLSMTSPTSGTRPPSFLSDSRLTSHKDTTHRADVPLSRTPSHHDLASEIERLRALSAEKEATEKELAEKYAQLEQQHHDTLDMVEELKTEVAQVRAAEASSPRSPQPIIRRKSSQNVMIIDRAHRSFASLRNIAADNFENQPDLMQNFELNLNSAMHELHARSERIQELEADVAAAKKEMETKMTIISGLTRERSSLKASPMDMSLVSTLKNQLEMTEGQLQEMRESHAASERELNAEIAALRAALQERNKSILATTASADKSLSNGEENENAAGAPKDSEPASADERIMELESELTIWESKHQTALASMRETESQMKKHVEELENQVATLNAKVAQQEDAGDENAKAEREEQQKMIMVLRDEVEEHKAIISSNAARVAELEAVHVTTKAELDEAIRTRDLHASQCKTQQELLNNLEQQIAAHEQALQTHQEGVKLLRETHVKELEEVRAMEQKGYEEQVGVLMHEQAEAVRILEAELNDARGDLAKMAAQVAAGLGVDDANVETFTERINSLIADQKALHEAQAKKTEMEQHMLELSNINDTILKDLEQVKSSLSDILTGEGEVVRGPAPVTEQLSAIRKKMTDLESKNKKNSRLVEELEDQLQTNFDHVQITNNRISTLQTEQQAQLDKAIAAKTKLEADLESLRAEYMGLQAKYDEVMSGQQPQRTNSMNSHLRKSASHTSLPSPPPAIPLPPLPVANGPSSPTMPSSPTGMRPASKDDMASLTQIHEDQEARIRMIEKHLDAEKQLTQTLEEALTDLEKQSNKVKADCEAWRKRCGQLEAEIKELKDRPTPSPQQDNRWSLHAVEEERKKRQAAEAARAHLEERMNALSKQKKKKGSLNCF